VENILSRWLAAWITSNYIGLGKNEADALPGTCVSACKVHALVIVRVPGWEDVGVSHCTCFSIIIAHAAKAELMCECTLLIPVTYTRMEVCEESQDSSCLLLRSCWVWIAVCWVWIASLDPKCAVQTNAELRRRGVVCSSVRDGEHFFEVPRTQGLSAVQVASLLRLRAR